MKHYSTLTVRGQARRLRALALNALTHYKLDVTRLRPVTNDMNGIFRVDTRDGRKFILRVILPEGGHDRDHVAAEMDWLAAFMKKPWEIIFGQPIQADVLETVLKGDLRCRFAIHLPT